ncbi:MAG: hypothetical protein KDA28_07875, partial [Phycisphaerales bacterium]|nr:hypothetical protein [Phycisphaerales bacterium]
MVKVQKASIENSGIVLNPNQIFGRVLMSGHEKGRPFHPSEFFPEGTQAGPTAGVPEGKFGVTV